MKDVFHDFQPEEHPPYEQWILAEAHGNLELADLIERREIMFDEVRAIGGLPKLESADRAKAQAYIDSIYAEISERKTELGIDLPEEH